MKRTEALRSAIRKEMELDGKAKKDGKPYTSSTGPDYKAAKKNSQEDSDITYKE